MLYFGDRSRRLDARELLGRLEVHAARAARLPAGVARHAEWVGLLVEAGELSQGIADEDLRARGADDVGPASAAAMQLVRAIAEAVVTSWRSGFERGALAVRGALASLARAPLPAEVEVRPPEGYEHSALYPEGYAEAAGALGAGPLRVVGIRSIGTGLAAVVAAAAGVRAPLTVRPVGEPHAREVTLSPALAARVAADARARWAVVDAGPGLSGSSFAAAARALEAAGVARARIHFFPSHPGAPGSAASTEWRARWAKAPRHVVSFEELALGARGLPRWIAEVVGPPSAPPVDLSAGRWRALAFDGGWSWPAVFREQERRKYLVVARGARWLAEFVGIGGAGERRYARARALGGAGLAPSPAGLCHGFLVRPWVDATPLTVAEADAPFLVARVAEYLAFRARSFGAESGEGASPDELLGMARHNARLALGEARAAEVERFADGARLAARVTRPVAVDGKLEPWEWLLARDGRLLKADAVQHADAHDLAGCQDVGWDVAAARFELGLGGAELAELVRRVECMSGAELPRAALAFYEVAYLALRIGRWHWAVAAETDVAERARAEAEIARYRAALAARLEGRSAR